jgi:glucose-1-phosphate adenylyltransferase
MDYQPMLHAHEQSGADLTVAVRRVNPHETHRYGIVTIGSDDRIIDFREKPRRSLETLASMGIYVFRREVLVELLQGGDYMEFVKHVLPAMVKQGRYVRAYSFPGYWADVGTVQAYWEANMSLLAEDPALNLYDPEWVIHTRSEERAPAKVGANAQVGGSLLSNGSRVEGTAERSIISPGVYIAEGAVVRDSVILYDTVIEAGAVVDRCIVDKNVVIAAGAQIGDGDDNTPNVGLPEVLNTGLTLIGENSVVPEGVIIGRNVVVHPRSEAKAFGKKKKVASGAEVGANQR